MPVSANYLLTAQKTAQIVSEDLHGKMFEFKSLMPLFRRTCLGASFAQYIRTNALSEEPIDLRTLRIRHPKEHPILGRVFQTAKHAAQGALLLCGSEHRSSIESDLNLKAQLFYLGNVPALLDSVWTLAAENPIPSVDVFKKMAIEAFIHAYDATYTSLAKTVRGVIKRDWPGLAQQDIRWVLACPQEEHARVLVKYPQAQPLWDAFALHRAVLSLHEAIDMVWSLASMNPHPCMDALPLPCLDDQPGYH